MANQSLNLTHQFALALDGSIQHTCPLGRSATGLACRASQLRSFGGEENVMRSIVTLVNLTNPTGKC